MFDLVIANGRIIDGSGSPPFAGHVGIQDDRVRVLRGDIHDVDRARTIDASGRVVCPGFIDFHAHSGLVALDAPQHEPKVRQGVTTEVIGVDGNSYAPFRNHEDLRRFLELNSGLDGYPAFERWWLTVKEYLDRFDEGVAVNFVYLIGNSPVRIAAAGWHDRPVTSAELADMRAIVREGMTDGAFGISTGLDYPPGSYASTDELVELSKVVHDLGGIYHTHVRYKLGDRFLDPMQEALEIGRRSGIPVHITHLYKRVEYQRGADVLLALLEHANEHGLEVTFDSYPYTYNSTRLPIIFPAWTHDGGPDRLRLALTSQDDRRRLRDEIVPRVPWQEMWLTNFHLPDNQDLEGRSIAEIAALRRCHEVDAICDLLAEEDLRISYVAQGASGFTRWKFLAHPLAMVGSDGLLIGDYPSPRTYGTFPSVLGEFVRDESFMTLADAIRRMTSFPARRLGLPDRGLLVDGNKADVVVFDPQTVRAPATRRDPKQFPVGIDHVVVNGKVVVEDAVHTGALPGRALRHGSDS